MNDLISIIVPCHNAEKYLVKCLDSIIKQTYNNIEVVIVNDGSTDSSREIIERYLSDERVKCIDQENGGEYAARNTGLNSATGEYIGFVDADDYIEPEMYEKMYRAIKEHDADMAVTNFNLVYEEPNRESQRCYAHMVPGLWNIYDNVYSYWVNNCAAVRPNNYACTRLYKRCVLVDSKVQFEQFRHSADTLFNFKVLPHMKKVVFVNEGLYNYLQRQSSGIHTIAKKANLANLYSQSFQALVDYYKEKNFKEFFEILPMHAYSRFRSVFFYSRLAGFDDEEIINKLLTDWKDKDIYKYLTDKRD